jgi:hypothetical protein
LSRTPPQDWSCSAIQRRERALNGGDLRVDPGALGDQLALTSAQLPDGAGNPCPR